MFRARVSAPSGCAPSRAAIIGAARKIPPAKPGVRVTGIPAAAGPSRGTVGGLFGPRARFFAETSGTGTGIRAISARRHRRGQDGPHGLRNDVGRDDLGQPFRPDLGGRGVQNGVKACDLPGHALVSAECTRLAPALE